MRTKTLILSALLGLCATPLFAQTSTPVAPPANMQGTNAPMNPLQLLGMAMPSYDPTLTNTFNTGELVVGITPLWKTQTASGSTPYLSTAADYFFTKHVGVEAELVSLGNGAGSSTLDSATVMAVLRKDSGNLAGYLMLGPSYSVNGGRIGADVGLGFEYRYQTGVGIFCDTRYCYAGSSSANNGFLTRTGLRFHF